MKHFLALIFSAFALIACSSTQESFYLIDAPEPAGRVRVNVSTLELLDVTLPGHASDSAVMMQMPDGALVPFENALWADDPRDGFTTMLARSLDEGSTATVAVEPWPLYEPAQAVLDVRVDTMLAKSNGQFVLSGQFAIQSPDGAVRERVERFRIITPISEATPGQVSDALGVAIDGLAVDIIASLSR